MKKKLLDVLCMSEKRKQVLLLLRNEAKDMETLLNSIDTTRQALLPQMKILQEHYLIEHYDDMYELTTIGKLIVEEMKPLLDTTEVLDIDINYWGTHSIDLIPPHLLKRIYEINDCVIIEPSLLEMYEINKDFLQLATKSRSLFFIFTFMHPTFPFILQQFIAENKNILVIINKELLQKIEEEWSDLLKKLIADKKVKFYLHQGDIGLLSLSLSDCCFVLRLLPKSKFSNKQIISRNPEACKWCEDIYNYYLNNSTLITEI
ncbi:helix-turn-helix transcriptional regulator [Methanolobus sp. WCC5]|uniref:helix-turn-helix transcriptional regulator n=1 Tax=Methanolobus sp. WCC5 TaxID=3125785 RepID=UPI003250A20A